MNFFILTFFRILLIALAFYYLHITLTGQKEIADFLCFWADVQIRNASAATRMPKMSF